MRAVTIAIPIKRGLKAWNESGADDSWTVTIAIPIKRGLKVVKCQAIIDIVKKLQLLSRLKGDWKADTYNISFAFSSVTTAIPIKRGLKDDVEKMELPAVTVTIAIPIKRGLKVQI